MAAALRRFCGMGLILAGLVLLPIAFIPGLPLIMAGAAMLGPDHLVVRTGRTWLAKAGGVTGWIRSAVARKAVGIALIVAGLVAVPVPILPGLPLIVAGAAMLGPDHPVVRTSRSWLEKTGIWRKERTQDELPNLQS